MSAQIQSKLATAPSVLQSGFVNHLQPVSVKSTFGQHVWDLGCMIARGNVSPSSGVMKFDVIVTDPIPQSRLGSPSRVGGSHVARLTDPAFSILYLSVKEHLFARLHNPPPEFYKMSAETVLKEKSALICFIRWMVLKGISKFSSLDPGDEEEFLRFLGSIPYSRGNKTALRSDHQVAAILTTLQRLWAYRDRMTDSLPFNPFNGRSPNAVLMLGSSRTGENRTPPIPDEVMESLGRTALNYVMYYGTDIFRAREVVEATRRSAVALLGGDGSKGSHSYPLFKERARKALQGLAISHYDDNEPWRPSFRTLRELRHEERMLLAACYIVIAWLTGMRPSEITSIREDCLRRERTADGLIERIKIRAILYKGSGGGQGRPETWVTIEPVAQAVEILKTLTADLRTRAKKAELFLVELKRWGISVPTSNSCNELLRDFAIHARVPDVDGKPWSLCSRQFRRTLARWIARRPFGEIAGMLQFKQLDVAIFEGYCARDADWRKTRAEEKLLSDIEVMSDFEHDLREGALAGPKGLELLEAFRGVAGDRRSDDVGFMLDHLIRTLHVGPYNYCFYDPDNAMCQQHVPAAERVSPITNHCRPDQCPNSCITKRHLPEYESQLVQIKSLLQRPKLSEPQKMALRQQEEIIERVVEPLRIKKED